MDRIFLITNVPTPYRLPLFNELSRQLASYGVFIKVLFSTSGYARRQWQIDWKAVNFEYDILNGKAISLDSHETYLFTYPGLLRRIRRERPALVISAGFSTATIMLCVSRIWTRTPFLIWSEENRPQSLLRQIQRRLLVAGAAGAIVCGSESKRYMKALGTKEDRIWTAISTVDTDFFGSLFQPRDERPKPGFKHILLCISVLVPRRQLDTVLRATACLAERRADFEVVIVGSGPQRDELENLARALGIAQLVTFTGFLQRPQLAEVLRRASCFLFPSTYDVWGMVLIEAMAAGLPCISSIHAGATVDLIENGVTGYAIDFTDTEAVCERIQRLLDDPDHARKMGTAAHEQAKRKASIAISARGFVQAIEAAHRSRTRTA